MTTLSQRMLDLGTAKSEIREAFAFAQARAADRLCAGDPDGRGL